METNTPKMSKNPSRSIQMLEKFLRVLNMWKELETRTRKYGTQHSLYISEIHTIDVIGHHEHLNITQIAQKSLSVSQKNYIIYSNF